MSPTAVFRHSPDVVSTELDDDLSDEQAERESVLLDLKTRRYYSLNEVGTCIWQRLGEGSSIEEIAAVLHEGWAVERAEAERHVRGFIQELFQEGLVEEAGASSSG